MRTIAAFTLVATALTACSTTGPNAASTATFRAGPCEVGIYGATEPFVVITRNGDENRYSRSDGRAGSMADQNNVICGDRALRVDGTTVLTRRPIRIEKTRFEVDGAMLAGQLLEPHNANASTALIVYAHGSEEIGWIDAARDPYQMVARGLSVFVYDKRGTGQSTGQYSQNFPQLASDLVAASAVAKRLAAGRHGRFGLFGLSQGGWIAPLAAERAGADFIGIGYGLVVDILEEDASQVALELTEAGFGPETIAKARQLTNVTARLAVSGYTDGLNELDELRRRYGDEAWYPTVRGGFSGVILGMSTDELRRNGIPMFDRLNIDWTLNPVEVIRDVPVPQLWVLAGADREAPYEKTLERLQALRAHGKEISIYVFPNTDHGMWEFKQNRNGTRETTRVTPGFYDLMADWAKRGTLRAQYGSSVKR